MKYQSKLVLTINRLLAATLALSTFVGTSAQAAYNQSVTWSDMSSLDLRPVFKSEYASSSNLFEPSIPDSATDLVLRDADGRINKEFHVPQSMKENVAFWLKIYTEYTTQHLVIFDSKHPALVYEALDFRELSRTSRNLMAFEIVRKQRIHKKVAAYHWAFKHLAKNPNPLHPTVEEANILKVLPLLPHKHTFAELNRTMHFQSGQRDNIIKGLLAAEAFFPKMEDLFQELGVPTQLTRLSLVESSFDLSAHSRADAMGVWQFLRPSGKEYLTIDDQHQIDERLSPLKATVAAGKLLKRNFSILHDWSLAVTAYNHGPGGLPHMHGPADRAKVAQLFSTCEKHSRLGFASKNYYAEFLAVLHAEAYRKLYYGDAPFVAKYLTFTRFEQTTDAQTAIQLAEQHHLALADFHLMNPDIRNVHRNIPAGFWIALPSADDDFAGLKGHIHVQRGSKDSPARAKAIVKVSSRATHKSSRHNVAQATPDIPMITTTTTSHQVNGRGAF
jgi:membrane-bound lytic murein transglycosylase D